MLPFNGHKKFLAGILLLIFLTAGGGWPSSLRIVQGKTWNEEIDQNNLQDGPGSELIPTVETAANFGRIDISKTKGVGWELSVSRDSGFWNPALTLSVRRTNNGDNPLIYGGTAYQEIGTMEQLFFWGTGDNSKIEFQMKVDGLSIHLGAEEFSTTVTYTLVDAI
jgi:hypothetical protein